MSFSQLKSLLNGHLHAFAVDHGYAVAWENRRFVPPKSAVYLRPHLLTGEQRAAALGPMAEDFQPGIFQVDVLVPQLSGWGDVYGIGDLLRRHFRRGLHLMGEETAVTIRSVSAGPAMVEDTRYKLPISINFHAYMVPA